MITTLNVASIMVLDKDEALEFYVDKLGLEKGSDVRQGGYRWLTVRVPGDPSATEISLEQPGPPLHDEATAAQLRERIDEVTGGMRPKLAACVDAVEHGVGAAHIVDGREQHSLLLELFTIAGTGTKIFEGADEE
jgi:catechol 2,3-dioxygenase-like lactoylglutathione lyase family enzyme